MSKKVLVCDDEQFIVRAVSLKLSNAGYEVLCAADGMEALELARTHHPDLVITDCQMPRLNGLELCAEMDRRPETRDIPRIMLTGKGFEFEESQARQAAGIRALVSKPFSPRELLSLVSEILATGAEG